MPTGKAGRVDENMLFGLLSRGAGIIIMPRRCCCCDSQLSSTVAIRYSWDQGRPSGLLTSYYLTSWFFDCRVAGPTECVRDRPRHLWHCLVCRQKPLIHDERPWWPFDVTQWSLAEEGLTQLHPLPQTHRHSLCPTSCRSRQSAKPVVNRQPIIIIIIIIFYWTRFDNKSN